MTLYEIALKVKSEGAHLIRETPEGIEAKIYEGKGKKGWILLDSFTSGGLVSLYENLNEANKAKFQALPVVKAIAVMWKLVK